MTLQNIENLLAKVKEVYQEGLSYRYGKKPNDFRNPLTFRLTPLLSKLKKAENSALPVQDFINEKYLGTIRNFLREGWILTYLFGASPAANPSFMEMPEGFKEIGGAFAGEYATSIRTSHLGYYSRVQEQQAISFNSFNTYLSDMMRAISTPNPKYSSIPSQLNANVLQVENEHYSRIRPKRVPLEKRPLALLKKED